VGDIFNVSRVGTELSGFVNAGKLTVGSHCVVYIGPTDHGTFIKTVAKATHIARTNTGHVSAGQAACLAFSLNKEMRKKLRRGMVALTSRESETSTKELDADICVLKGEGTTIRRSFQGYVHVLNVRQSAFARSIEIVKHNTMGLPKSTTRNRRLRGLYCLAPRKQGGGSF
jgi:elongation factor 1-alpha